VQKGTMLNWDDYRFFLAVARSGTVTGAAHALSVNHSTVSRRIAAMEETTNVRLFDRRQEGYFLTDAGLALLDRACSAEEAVHAAERTLRAHDHSLTGELVITAPLALMVTVLTPIIARFRQEHPDLILSLVSTDDIANLNRREADIAIRASNTPDDHLVGRKLCVQRTAVCAQREYWRQNKEDPTLIILGTRSIKPDWALKTYPNSKIGCRLTGKLEVLAAVESGVGIARLPCRLGDTRPELIRVPPRRLENDLDIWLLMQPEMQHAPRTRAFADFVYNSFRREAELFEGSACVTVSDAD